MNLTLNPERALSALSRDFRPLADAWIALCIERGVMVCIVQTRRSFAQHVANVEAGRSSANLSLHLPRRLRSGTAAAASHPDFMDEPDAVDAMDLAPFSQYQLHGPDKLTFDSNDVAFGVIAACAEQIGLRSGVRWSSPFDPGHGEFPFAASASRLAAERQRTWPSAYASMVEPFPHLQA